MSRKLAWYLMAMAAVLQCTFACGQESKSPAEVFAERIMPIFRSSDPSSCVQCHLSSVDLKNYILPSHERTFVSLRDQGLIDLENPASSKILKLIDMGQHDSDEYAKRLNEEMRLAEYEAFAAWIVASCDDEKLVNMPKSDALQQAGPIVPSAVIRHSRKSRVVDSFARNVWSQRMRCFPCHTPNEIGPQQTGAREKFEGWYAQFGEQMLIFKKTPEETLRYLADASKESNGGDLPLLNLENPENSLLVLKPMSKLPPLQGDRRIPTYSEPVYHMGGLKIHKNDHTHKAFLNWIKDYAAVANGTYKAAGELPRDNWYPTQNILRMRDVPDSWDTGTTVQLFVYRRDYQSDSWSIEPVAFTQGSVTPKRIVNGALILLAPGEDDQFAKWKSDPNRLPAGRYLVRAFADRSGKLGQDPTALLGPEDFGGEVEIRNAKWQTGFPNAEWVSARLFKGEDQNR